MALPLEASLALAGISLSTVLVLFVGPRARRLLMAFGLSCAVGLILFQVLGFVRTAMLVLILYWARAWLARRGGDTGE